MLKKSNKLISYNEILRLIEVEKNEQLKLFCIHFEEALNDWPSKGVTEPKYLLEELKSRINKSLTKNNLEEYINQVDVISSAWEVESISSVIKAMEVAKVDKDEELDVLLFNLKK